MEAQKSAPHRPVRAEACRHLVMLMQIVPLAMGVVFVTRSRFDLPGAPELFEIFILCGMLFCAVVLGVTWGLYRRHWWAWLLSAVLWGLLFVPLADQAHMRPDDIGTSWLAAMVVHGLARRAFRYHGSGDRSP